MATARIGLQGQRNPQALGAGAMSGRGEGQEQGQLGHSVENRVLAHDGGFRGGVEVIICCHCVISSLGVFGCIFGGVRCQ